MGLHGATFIAPLPGTTPVGMSATDGRLAMGGIFGVTPQLVSGGGIAQSGSNMNITVAQSVFQLADVTNAAATAFLPTDSTVLTPAAGPGSGSRIDIITIPLKNWENGDGISQSQPTLVAGIAGTPGTQPTVPAGSYLYAQIQVPTSASLATSCTVTIYGNTTFARPLLNVPSVGALSGLVMPINTKAYSAADNITYRSNGSVWKPWESDWVAYTPTLTGVTTTGGTFTGCQYQFRSGELYVEGKFTLGSGSAVTAAVKVNHPSTYLVSAGQAADPYPLGLATALKSGIAVYFGNVTTNGVNTSASLNTVNAAGTYSINTVMTAAAPITFANLDSFVWKYDFTPA